MVKDPLIFAPADPPEDYYHTLFQSPICEKQVASKSCQTDDNLFACEEFDMNDDDWNDILNILKN